MSAPAKPKVGRVAPNAPWRKVRIGDTLRLVNGAAFKPTDWSDSGFPIVRIQNLNNPDAPFNLTNRELPEKFRLRGGELLFAWSGTPGTSFGAHIWRGGEAWLNQHIFNVHFDEREWDKRFLRLAINQNLAEYIRAAHGGAGLAHITKGKFEDSELVQPDIAEQRRIVAEIEKQFTRLDAGVAALRRVQANLKRYRAAVLKAACEGRLVPTEADLARKEGRTFETGEQLLERILSDRRKIHVASGRYAEPNQPSAAKLTALPSAWVWASFDQTCFAVSDEGKKLAKGAYLESGKFPVIDQGEKQIGGFSNDASLLFSGELPVILFGDHTRRFKLATERFIVGADGVKLIGLRGCWDAKFAWYQFQQLDFEDRGYSRHFQFVRNAPLLLPPLTEQKRIVAEVERRLSVVDDLETVVAANLTRATRLRQSILRDAFVGSPVRQDPSDKSAEALRKVSSTEESKLAIKKAEPANPKIMPAKPVTSLEELLQRLEALGGAASPDHLIAASGLGEEVEKFFDLLREGRNSGALDVPTGTSDNIKRN